MNNTFLQMQAKRDLSVESAIEEWIEAAVGEKLTPPGDLSESLKSGVFLCKYEPHITASKFKNQTRF